MQRVAVESLSDAWARGCALAADRTALQVDGVSLTYRELDERARATAAALEAADPAGHSVAVLAQRSLDAYLGVLGAVLAGRTYVPLHPRFPVARTAAMLQRSGATSLVVGPEADGLVGSIIEQVEGAPLVVLPTRSAGAAESSLPVGVRRIGIDELPHAAALVQRSGEQRTHAYVLFTSGSTGQPKGVGITHSNVAAYLRHVVDTFGYSPADRCSQMFDLTFDLSVHDLFVTWAAGACLCVPSARAVLAPSKYIRDAELTTWFSVPSVAMVMGRLRMMKPGAFPGLRLSLFCGEALSSGTAAQWAAASPNSTLHNLYGPTEATIAITSHQWSAESTAGVVPIGVPFPGHEVAVIDEEMRRVEPGRQGELCLSGPQVASGYLDDAERSSASFVALPGSDARWYRTGDLVEWSPSDGLLYRGRVDDQVQIMGFRVELVEVDAALRSTLGTELAVAVSHPPGPSAEALYACVVGADLDEGEARARCSEQLPPYMVPQRVFFVDQLPLNSNGKVDRGAVRQMLQGLLDD